MTAVQVLQQDDDANKRRKMARPGTIYVVEHSYTCVHLTDSDEQTTDNLGAYYSERNAVLSAVKFIEDEFKVTFSDKNTWEEKFFKKDEQVEGKDDNNEDEEEDLGDEDDDEEEDDDYNEFSIRELYETKEFMTEVETEGIESDEHFVRINAITVEDA